MPPRFTNHTVLARTRIPISSFMHECGAEGTENSYNRAPQIIGFTHAYSHAAERHDAARDSGVDALELRSLQAPDWMNLWLCLRRECIYKDPLQRLDTGFHIHAAGVHTSRLKKAATCKSELL